MRGCYVDLRTDSGAVAVEQLDDGSGSAAPKRTAMPPCRRQRAGSAGIPGVY